MTPPRRLIACAAMLALVLAACSGSGKKKAKPVTLRIGVLFTTGGQGGDLASAVLGSAKMATDAATKQRVKIETVEADYAGDLTKVAAAVASLESKVDAIIVGTDDTGVVPALANVTTIPVLHPIVTADAAVGRSGRAFRFAPSNLLQAQRMVQFLVQHRKYTRIVVLTDDTSFGKEGVRDLNQAFADAGVTPVATLQFTPGGDIHTPVSAAGQKGAQAVIVWVTSPGEASRIVVEEQKMNFAYQVVLSGNLATATFAKNASSQVSPVAFREGMLSVGPWAGPWFNLSRIIDFYAGFKEQNSALAPVQAAAVYDAFGALVTAARARGTSSDGLAAGLESLADFAGAGVPVTFGPSKHDGVDLDDLGMYGFTKNQKAPGGAFAPDTDTGGGFFTVVTESLDLPPKLQYLTATS